MPPKGKVRIVYLGAIRVSDHARFTWRVFAHAGSPVFDGYVMNAPESGPVIYDLQIMTQRSEDKSVWQYTGFEAVAITDDQAKPRHPFPISVKGGQWRNLGKIPETTGLDDLVTVLEEKEIVSDVPIDSKNKIILATVAGAKPTEPGLPVRFEFEVER